MIGRVLAAIALWVCLAGSGRAQERTGYETVELRVSMSSPGGHIVVDRGASDGLAVGDTVLFFPREGGSFGGTVLRVEDRSAAVSLDDGNQMPQVGTRGRVLVPRKRLDGLGAADDAGDPAVTGDAGGSDLAPWLEPDESELPEQPPWDMTDDGWRPGMPLLSQVDAVRPEDRGVQITGRTYLIGDQTFTTDSERHAGFFRSGADFEFENLWGRGGTLHVDAELNYRTTRLPADTGGEQESRARIRIDRLSYMQGGTRFDPLQWEAGRFLQRGMPEFGVLDGMEYAYRLDNGHRFGASIGFLPEPDQRQRTGEDFQVAAFYHWVRDPSEVFSVDLGIQKTLHNRDNDRNLVVAKTRYAPPDAWNYTGSVWIDLYNADEEVEDGGIELTQAYLIASRAWEDGSGLNVSYRRQRFPDIQRWAFLAPPPDALEDAGFDRLTLRGWRSYNPTRRITGEVSGWVGSGSDGGGNVEIGLEFDETFHPEGRSTLVGFVNGAQFEDLIGARYTYSQNAAGGFWDVSYEVTVHDLDGFVAGSSDLLQHRLRGSREFRGMGEWDLSLYGETVLNEEEDAFTAGFYLTRSF